MENHILLIMTILILKYICKYQFLVLICVDENPSITTHSSPKE